EIDDLQSQRLSEEGLFVSPVHQTDKPEHDEGRDAQDPAGDPPLSGVNIELPAKPCPLACESGGFVENHRQVPTGFFLQQNRGSEKSHIIPRHTFDQIQHGITKGQTQLPSTNAMSEIITPEPTCHVCPACLMSDANPITPGRRLNSSSSIGFELSGACLRMVVPSGFTPSPRLPSMVARCSSTAVSV